MIHNSDNLQTAMFMGLHRELAHPGFNPQNYGSKFQNWSQNIKARRGRIEIEIDAYINLDH